MNITLADLEVLLDTTKRTLTTVGLGGYTRETKMATINNVLAAMGTVAVIIQADPTPSVSDGQI